VISRYLEEPPVSHKKKAAQEAKMSETYIPGDIDVNLKKASTPALAGLQNREKKRGVLAL